MTALEILSRRFRPVSLPDAPSMHRAPHGTAVYLLVRGQRIVYVGSGRARARLNAACVRKRSDGWIFDRALCLAADFPYYRQLERALIVAIAPQYNKMIPRESKRDRVILARFGLKRSTDVALNESACSYCRRVRPLAAMRLWTAKIPGIRNGKPRWSCRDTEGCADAKRALYCSLADFFGPLPERAA